MTIAVSPGDTAVDGARQNSAAQNGAAQNGAGDDLGEEFDLDITIVEGEPLNLALRLTDDNCGTTCESACNSC